MSEKFLTINGKFVMSGNKLVFSNSTPPTPEYPHKGDLITINGSQYRVLDISGSNAKVMGMFDCENIEFNDESPYSNVYSGSKLDSYLNTTWYNSQSSEFKSAINDSLISTSIYQYYDEPNTPNTPTYTYQYQYDWDRNDYENADRVSTTSEITRKVYALDLKDIYDYFGKVCISSNEIMTLFFNQTTANNKTIWLRSGENTTGIWYSNVYFVDGGSGTFITMGTYNSHQSRPCFNIDLSKISWN